MFGLTMETSVSIFMSVNSRMHGGRWRAPVLAHLHVLFCVILQTWAATASLTVLANILSEPAGVFSAPGNVQYAKGIGFMQFEHCQCSVSIFFWAPFVILNIQSVYLSCCVYLICLYNCIYFLAFPELGFKCNLILWWYFMPVWQREKKKNPNVLSGAVKWFAILSSALAGAFDLAIVPGE